jgi:8-hydroxy-5-deazaflavin:NADPH oxidoreductase
MNIAVIGRGKVGATLGGKWVGAGHQVVFGSRKPDGPDTASVAAAVEGAEVVVLAVPGSAAGEVVATLGEKLRDKVVIDTTNDVAGSGKLHALDEIADGAHPVRAFNSLGWENFVDPVIGGVRADLLFASEDGHPREVAEQLIRDVGFEPVWVGELDAFDLVDSLTRLWFTLALRRGLGRRLAFKVLTEE